MAENKIRVEWSEAANNQFNEILEYLQVESQSAVVIVRKAILNEINKMSKNPTSNPPDRFKKNNDGNFRACTVFNYRISYYVDIKVIYILRIRHTSREPLEF